MHTLFVLLLVVVSMLIGAVGWDILKSQIEAHLWWYDEKQECIIRYRWDWRNKNSLYWFVVYKEYWTEGTVLYADIIWSVCPKWCR